MNWTSLSTASVPFEEKPCGSRTICSPDEDAIGPASLRNQALHSHSNSPGNRWRRHEDGDGSGGAARERGARSTLPRTRLVAGGAARRPLRALRAGGAGRARGARRPAAAPGPHAALAGSGAARRRARGAGGRGARRRPRLDAEPGRGAGRDAGRAPPGRGPRQPADSVGRGHPSLRGRALRSPGSPHRRAARPRRDRGARHRGRGAGTRPGGGGRRRRRRGVALAAIGFGAGAGAGRSAPQARYRIQPPGGGPRPPHVHLQHHRLPKAVMHTADTLAALNVTFAERFGLGPDSPIFMPSPLGHSVGAIHGARLALHTGAPLVLQDRWDPARALEAVATHGCRFTSAATPFLKDLVDARGRPRGPPPGGRSSPPSPGSSVAAPRSPRRSWSRPRRSSRTLGSPCSGA